MKLKIASYKAIQYACMKFHYAKRVPVARVSYSVFNDKGEWCGVICYGSGAGDKVAKHFNMAQGECCELVRVALNGKQSTTSKAVAISLKLLKKQNPLLRLVYSYADVDQNHMGTIYQATNWIYLGQSSEYSSGYIINGKQTHRRSTSAMLKGKPTNLANVQKYLDKNSTEFISKGKRKYVQIFDKTLLKKYSNLAIPYPKKKVLKLAVEVHELNSSQSSEKVGGANPTQPLNL